MNLIAKAKLNKGHTQLLAWNQIKETFAEREGVVVAPSLHDYLVNDYSEYPHWQDI